jgi:FKBP-type peptidyl-prolyl cis-trans isomerase FklB
MEKFLIGLALAAAVSLPCQAQKKKNSKQAEAPAPRVLLTATDSVSYALGANIGSNLKQQQFDSVDYYFIGKAIMDVIAERELLISLPQTGEIINNHIAQLKEKAYAGNKKSAEAFLAENAKRPGVTTLPSGLQYEVIAAGEGEIPNRQSRVTVHYHGSLIDGRVFDSSVNRGQPATFGVTQVIKGWTEALQLMPVGSKWKLFIPSDLAYGANPNPSGIIEPFMALIFEVEILGIAE